MYLKVVWHAIFVSEGCVTRFVSEGCVTCFICIVWLCDMFCTVGICVLYDIFCLYLKFAEYVLSSLISERCSVPCYVWCACAAEYILTTLFYELCSAEHVLPVYSKRYIVHTHTIDGVRTVKHEWHTNGYTANHSGWIIRQRGNDRQRRQLGSVAAVTYESRRIVVSDCLCVTVSL